MSWLRILLTQICSITTLHKGSSAVTYWMWSHVQESFCSLVAKVNTFYTQEEVGPTDVYKQIQG